MHKPKIVILDAYCVNPGDQSWEELERLGELTVYEHGSNSDPKETLRRCAGAEIVLTNKVPLPREVLEQLPDLKFIAVQATGYNIVDTVCARERGIAVSNVPGYSTASVAQLTFALILELYAKVAEQNQAVHAGDWSRSPDFTFYTGRIQELAGRTLGIFGFGAIGQNVGKIGAAFGMKVIYHARKDKKVDFANFVDLPELFENSDVLTLHCPQTPDTLKAVNRQTLDWMKPSAILINTARGGLVDSDALADALNAGRLAGAGLDVLDQEPPRENHVLLRAKNCLITPHVGWASVEARRRLIAMLAENVRAYLAGTVIRRVD